MVKNLGSTLKINKFWHTKPKHYPSNLSTVNATATSAIQESKSNSSMHAPKKHQASKLIANILTTQNTKGLDAS